jgi:hypothetical protein
MFIISFEKIAAAAGFHSGADGKLNLPSNQETADALAAASMALIPEWKLGDEALVVGLTGPGPVWGYLTIAHALHGRAAKLIYFAPNTPEGIVVFNHGVQ